MSKLSGLVVVGCLLSFALTASFAQADDAAAECKGGLLKIFVTQADDSSADAKPLPLCLTLTPDPADSAQLAGIRITGYGPAGDFDLGKIRKGAELLPDVFMLKAPHLDAATGGDAELRCLMKGGAVAQMKITHLRLKREESKWRLYTVDAKVETKQISVLKMSITVSDMGQPVITSLDFN